MRTQEQLEARRVAQRRYEATSKGRATQQRFIASPTHKAYLKARYDEHKEMALVYLGGVCASCGVTGGLEFDHVVAATKAYKISRGYNHAWETLVVELDKCQLLCFSCHVKKTNAERRSVLH